MSLTQINAAIAKLTYMTNGKIGRDWYSGRAFVLADKGDEWTALRQALEALRAARAALSS